jgi:integrase
VGELAQGEKESRQEWLARLTPEQREQLKAWRAEHRWHPHQLRHNLTTRIKADHGAEAAQVLLGDRTTRMLDVYAARDRRVAERVIAQVG